MDQSGGHRAHWRVTVDSTGLWLNGAWKTRHVPWEQLRSVRRNREGAAEIRMDDGSTWRLTGMGAPRIE
ncbi:PH domain-containing protein [Streptomyces tendae]|uniref:PH domain-containing protein n=1 Tax=Streptomyces tendae TaxID=1932 RepID=UPI0037163598